VQTADRILYSILLELSKDAQYIAADGKINFVPLKRVLKDRGQLEEIVGEHWLSALYDFVPTAANAAWYADIIRDRWERRRAISDSKQQIDLARILEKQNSLRLYVDFLKDAGVPEAVVMEMVGHDSEQMSTHYTHVGTHVGREALAKAAASLPDLG
jgi:replicative DNA helicase